MKKIIMLLLLVSTLSFAELAVIGEKNSKIIRIKSADKVSMMMVGKKGTVFIIKNSKLSNGLIPDKIKLTDDNGIDYNFNIVKSKNMGIIPISEKKYNHDALLSFLLNVKKLRATIKNSKGKTVSAKFDLQGFKENYIKLSKKN